MGGYRLGVDFGTSSTVAVLSGPDGRAKPLLFDASPLLSSGVFAGPGDAPLLTGADAERAALTDPAGFEANPKRRIDDRVIWLAEREVAVTDAIATVLARVSTEAERVAGRPPDTVVLTHPAGWSRTRLRILAAAAEQAQLGECTFIAEPAAAAAYFADVLGNELPVGRCLLVYDLGAGTCDVSVVRRTEGGLEVVATAGLDDVGGLDLDAAIVAHARSLTTTDTDAWRPLNWPHTPADQRARQILWRNARAAKEQLSRHTTADLHIPLVDTVIHLTRDEFLVGGSSRVPLVATLLHRTLRIAPTALDHPELVVAEGALHMPNGVAPPADTPTTGNARRFDRSTPIDITPGDGKTRDDTTDTGAVHWPHRRLRVPRDRVIVAGAAALVLVIVVGLWTFLATERTDRAGGPRQGTATPKDQSSPLATPTPTTTPTGQASSQTTSHTNNVNSVAFSPDGRKLASGSLDNTVRLWELPTHDTSAVLIGHTNYVHSVAFSPDGKTLASGSFDDTVRLWDVATRKTIATLTDHTDWVLGVAFSPDGRTLATASRDETVRLWNVATRKTIAVLTGHTDNVNSVAFSPDGKTLATASEDETVWLWDVPTRSTIATLTGHTDWINRVVFSPDGKTFATAGDDGTVRLWNVATRRTIVTLRSPAGFKDVAFSPDGKTLATAGDDGTVRLWNVATRKTAATYRGHIDNVLSVAFSPDGRTLASGGIDETVRTWKVGT
ncbi:Hsp70 family protein [Plantactinospora sp. CA-294935]|uniref:Hsp70 family protein n=1 Tax=Plantactinospora sp. CA-294935 TaxID=3240012 RepID=UPI003D9444C7